MNFPELIRACQLGGFTQQQIADFCGCAQSTISDIANGANSRPSFVIVDGLRKLARKKSIRVHLRSPEERTESATADQE